MRINEKHTPIKQMSGMRQRLHDWIKPKDETPPAAALTPVATEKPAKKKSKLAAYLRATHGVAPGGVDHDGQVLNPNSGQRSFASLLNGLSPRGPGK